MPDDRGIETLEEFIDYVFPPRRSFRYFRLPFFEPARPRPTSLRYWAGLVDDYIYYIFRDMTVKDTARYVKYILLFTCFYYISRFLFRYICGYLKELFEMLIWPLYYFCLGLDITFHNVKEGVRWVLMIPIGLTIFLILWAIDCVDRYLRRREARRRHAKAVAAAAAAGRNRIKHSILHSSSSETLSGNSNSGDSNSDSSPPRQRRRLSEQQTSVAYRQSVGQGQQPFRSANSVLNHPVGRRGGSGQARHIAVSEPGSAIARIPFRHLPWRHLNDQDRF